MKRCCIILTVILFLAVGAGCSGNRTKDDAAISSSVIREEITEWPHNPYTDVIIQPESGTPDYALFQESKFYAVFLKDITREEGERYVEKLIDNGYCRIAGVNETTSSSTLLQKDGVYLNISVAEQELGIYIALEAE